MLEKGKISPLQMFGLMIAFLWGSTIIIIPSAVAVSAGRDAWLSILLGALAGSGMVVIYSVLALRVPGHNFVQYSELILGKVPGKIAGLALIWFALHLGSLVVRNFGDFLNASILPQTPMVVINGMIVLLAVFAVRQGLEVIARVNDVLIPFLIFLILLLTALSLPNLEVNKILPVLEGGYQPVLKGALAATGFPFAETVLFTMIMPYVNRPGLVGRASQLGVLLGGLLLFSIVLRTLMTIGPGHTAKDWYPVLEAVRMIDIYNFIQRVESVIIINWVGLGFVKIVICFYAFVLGLAQWLNLKDYRPLVLPAGVLMVALSIFLYGNYVEEVAFAFISPPYKLTVALVLPLTMLIVASIRGIGRKG